MSSISIGDGMCGAFWTHTRGQCRIDVLRCTRWHPQNLKQCPVVIARVLRIHPRRRAMRTWCGCAPATQPPLRLCEGGGGPQAEVGGGMAWA